MYNINNNNNIQKYIDELNNITYISIKIAVLLYLLIKIINKILYK